ncbi:hypothetical protein SKAU_G00067630 [Synaphobranchus kaupii]|uniref:Uncharacterized protein n=1 Tax=Synaphobranchus kaupii TaxID=118154 RepID=A0A9Q1G708_SYNKA|nr:hypothetical protein SKAU_G00067630 [Synaphobranchus kaupii]
MAFRGDSTCFGYKGQHTRVGPHITQTLNTPKEASAEDGKSQTRVRDCCQCAAKENDEPSPCYFHISRCFSRGAPITTDKRWDFLFGSKRESELGLKNPACISLFYTAAAVSVFICCNTQRLTA